ncbi:MAG: NAD(P)H-binding protein [Acidimicrobiales bacterium]
MGTHVIVGAGPVGSGTAQRLADTGHHVKVVTRSGSGPQDHRIECVAADAGDADALAKLCAGADAVYNCANPPYHQWATAWPPLANSFLGAAEDSGAKLVTMSNLYVYPAGSSPMRPDTPLDPPSKKGAIRAAMWNGAGRARGGPPASNRGPGLGLLRSRRGTERSTSATVSCPRR